MVELKLPKKRRTGTSYCEKRIAIAEGYLFVVIVIRHREGVLTCSRRVSTASISNFTFQTYEWNKIAKECCL